MTTTAPSSNEVVDLRMRAERGRTPTSPTCRARLDAVFRDQERVRQNMSALDRNSSLYRRYLSDLEAQEDEVDALEAALAERNEERRALEAALDELIAAWPTTPSTERRRPLGPDIRPWSGYPNARAE
jgi:predicted RNase H-like nuclease (RuvC/YqgF family)